MSEFEDANGNLLNGQARRRAVKMDGMSRRELRRREAIEENGWGRCPVCELNFIGRHEEICEECEGRAVPCRMCGRAYPAEDLKEGLCSHCESDTR